MTTIDSNVDTINTNVNTINTKVDIINTTVNDINSTLYTVNSKVTQINNTVNTINSNVNTINTNVDSIKTTVEIINSTVNRINSTVTDINNTVTINNAMITNINSTVVRINSTVILINSTVNNINTIVKDINTTVISINSTVTNTDVFRISSLAAGSPRYPNEEALVEASFIGQNGSATEPDTINLTIYDKNDNAWATATKSSFTQGADNIWTFSKSIEASPTTGMYTVHLQASYKNVTNSKTVQFRIATGGPYRVALNCPSSSTVGQNLDCTLFITDEGEVATESITTVWVDTDGDGITDATEPQTSVSKQTVPLQNVTETISINVPSTHTTGTFVVRVKTSYVNSAQPDSRASDTVTLQSAAAPAPTAPAPSSSAGAGVSKSAPKAAAEAPAPAPSLQDAIKKAIERLAEEEEEEQKVPELPSYEQKIVMINYPEEISITKSQYAEQQFKFINLLKEEIHNVRLTIIGLPEDSYVTVPDTYASIKPNEIKSFIVIFKGNLEEGQFNVKHLITSDKAIEQIEGTITVKAAQPQQTNVLSSLTKTLSAEFTPIGIAVTIMVLTILVLFLKHHGVKEELELLRERFTRIRRKKDVRKEIKQMKHKLQATKKMFVNEIINTKVYEKTKQRLSKQIEELRKELGQKKTTQKTPERKITQKITKALSILKTKTKPTKKTTTKPTTHKHHHVEHQQQQKPQASSTPKFKIKIETKPTTPKQEQKQQQKTQTENEELKPEEKPIQKTEKEQPKVEKEQQPTEDKQQKTEEETKTEQTQNTPEKQQEKLNN